MAIVHSPDSEYSKEIEKWNTEQRYGGMRPNSFQAFPKMLYKAHARENGKVMCGDPLAAIGDPVGEAFSRSCQLIVGNEEQAASARRAGWYDSPDDAVAGYHAQQTEQANIAAQRHFADQRLSEQARAEADAADAATHEHLPAIPETPIRRRGRPRKAEVS